MKKQKNKYADINKTKKFDSFAENRKEMKWNNWSQWVPKTLMLVWFITMYRTAYFNESQKEVIRNRLDMMIQDSWFIGTVIVLLISFLLMVWCLPIVSNNHKHMFKTSIKEDILLTNGWFKYTRNPFYLIQMSFYIPVMIVMFWAISSLHLKFSIFAMILYVFFIYLTVIEEEKRLESKYGQKYLEYKKVTPRFWPRDWLGFLREARFPKQNSEPAQRV